MTCRFTQGFICFISSYLIYPLGYNQEANGSRKKNNQWFIYNSQHLCLPNLALTPVCQCSLRWILLADLSCTFFYMCQSEYIYEPSHTVQLGARRWMLLECRNIKQVAGSKPSLTYPHSLGGAPVFVDGAAELSDHIKRLSCTTQLGVICQIAEVAPDPTAYALACLSLFFQQKQEDVFFCIWFLHAAIMIKLLPRSSELCTMLFLKFIF